MPPPRVLVTRAPQQGSALAEQLRGLGLDPVLIPSIATVEPFSFAALDEALAHFADFHWVLFTSANAVEVFASRRPASMPLGGARVAAIGAATARALRDVGLAPDLVPPQAVAESLTDALLPFARQPDGTGTRFLLVRAEEGREHLPETLRASGAEVTVAPAYRTVVPESSVALLRSLLGAGAAGLDAVTFTSSSAARNLFALCETAGVVLPESALRISIGPVTSATLRELNAPPHAEAPEATVASLALTVAAVLAEGGVPRPR